MQFDLDAGALGILVVALLLGTPLLSLIGAIGAALTLGVRGGGVLLSLLVLPLYIPVLIFGAGAVEAHISGLGAGGHLSLLAALLALAVFFAPWATTAALRIALGMITRIIHWFKFASPQSFYPLAGKMIPWFWPLAALFGVAGLWISFFVAPTDAQQGEGYRIIFIHVPASWMSMFIYLVMAAWAGLGLAFNTRLSGMMAQALAPTGALMAFLSLVDRRPVGQADVGRLVGVGCAPDLRTDPVLPVHRLHRPAGRHRRPAPRRQGRRHPGAGRRGERADHLFLGEMVEHPASGRLGVPDQVAVDGADHALGHADHGAVLLDVLDRRGA